MHSILHSTFMNGPLQKADISFVMEENGKHLLSHQPQSPLIAASNMKLVITATALLSQGKEILPPLRTFAGGGVVNGVLEGDLILDFCGTSVFTARFPVARSVEERHRILDEQLDAYINQLKKVGVNSVNGDLKMTFKRWNANPENKHYTAAAGASYNENTLDTFVKNGRMQTSPANAAVFKVKAFDAVKTQDKVADNLIRYNPAVDSQDYWRLSKTSAVDYTRKMIFKELQRKGLQIRGKVTEIGRAKLLFETEFPESLVDYIKPLNTWSDNYRAEILALQLARVYKEKADYKFLNEAVSAALKNTGMNLKSLVCADGSGLSCKNRVSAEDLNTLLKFMASGKHNKDFKESLAVAGKTGTLRKRFKGTPFEGRFFGKTGTLNNVTALSGYWLRQGKPPITFSFIGNGADNKLFWEALEKFSASLLFML